MDVYEFGREITVEAKKTPAVAKDSVTVNFIRIFSSWL